MTAIQCATWPVLGDSRFVGTIRKGWVGSFPIHAAACALCDAAVYDQATFGDAASWFSSHLVRIHGVRSITVPISLERFVWRAA
jgi:hypothetical protein